MEDVSTSSVEVVKIETTSMGSVVIKHFDKGESVECLMLITDRGEVEVYANEVLDMRESRKEDNSEGL